MMSRISSLRDRSSFPTCSTSCLCIELASAFARNRCRNEIAAKKRIFHSEVSCSARMRRGGSPRILLSCRHFCSKVKVRGQRMVRLFLWCVVFGCCLCLIQASATEDKTLRGPGAQTCGEFAFDLRVNRNTENTYFDWAGVLSVG